jgi:hypothetical protein
MANPTPASSEHTNPAGSSGQELPQKSLTSSTLMVLNVFCSLQPKVHHAVAPIFREGADDERQERGHEPDGHLESLTPRERSCQSKASRATRAPSSTASARVRAEGRPDRVVADIPAYEITISDPERRLTTGTSDRTT